ncbi:MAG: VWA domain-containing protein, partial [Planctomycetota bacterium]
VAAARRADVSVFPVGLGSSRSPTNARVVDLEAPRRVYPGDKFAISAVLQATGESAIDVDVELLDRLDDQAANEGEIQTPTNNADPKRVSTTLPGAEVIDRQTVRLTPEQGLTDVRFEMEPESVGRRRLAIRLVAPPEDRNRADDFQMARYEVVARKLRVLAIAGGPTREYRFVRNLLYRDDSVRLDVWLQTGQPGMSQDADALLSAFPPSAESLFQYDAIMMFDPNWSMIDMASLDLIDRFLTQQAGGLAIIAGPVYHPRISGARADPRSVQIAGFFPVNLATRGVLLGGGRQGGANPWALDLTEEAEQAEFLWVADSPEDSLKVWQAFDGVYDYVGVKNAKPGAKVYSYFSDPTTEIGGSLPIFMASQFYGAGRVFFQGSGEMWRLRGDGDEYFDAYYTKLVRWISEGRLLRDSKRGVLLVDSTRAMLGQTISIRAVLVDDQFQPLQKDSVAARVLAPGNKVSDVRLLPAADAPDGGTFVGNFIVTAAGSYEVQLTVGETIDEEILRQNIQVRLPTSELERPRRDDETLQSLASATRGKYFAIDSSDSLAKVSQTLTETITPQPQVTMLSGTPDAEFAMRRNASLMWLIASVLAFEWLVRRLHKLA